MYKAVAGLSTVIKAPWNTHTHNTQYLRVNPSGCPQKCVTTCKNNKDLQVLLTSATYCILGLDSRYIFFSVGRVHFMKLFCCSTNCTAFAIKEFVQFFLLTEASYKRRIFHLFPFPEPVFVSLFNLQHTLIFRCQYLIIILLFIWEFSIIHTNQETLKWRQM